MLEELCNYASLREDIFIAACDPIQRAEMQALILEKYFSKNLDILKSTANYTQTIEEMVMKDSAIKYKTTFERTVEKAEKEVIEEERFIRSATFKKLVPRLYDNTCAISGLRVVAKANISMVDACHIVTFAESHDDHITNGIALSPTFHRAFDRGLISIDDNYRLLVSKDFNENYSPSSIHQLKARNKITRE